MDEELRGQEGWDCGEFFDRKRNIEGGEVGLDVDVWYFL